MFDNLVAHEFRNKRFKEYVLHFVSYVENLKTWATEEEYSEFIDYYNELYNGRSIDFLNDLIEIDRQYDFKPTLDNQLRYYELFLEHATQSNDYNAFFESVGVIDAMIVYRCKKLIKPLCTICKKREAIKHFQYCKECEERYLKHGFMDARD